MGNDTYSAFEEYEILGEFFPSEELYTARFSGKICYTPEKGLQLKYNIVDTDAPNQCECLLGVLENGKRCTLVGPFDFRLSGRRLGVISTKFGTHGFPFLLVGDFFNESQLFNNCIFTFYHMQEFFHPQGHINNVTYRDDVLEIIQGENWTIDLENRATGIDVTNNLSNVIMTGSEDALSELESAFKAIKTKYPSEYFLLRKSFQYVFNYKPDSPKKVEEISLKLNKLSSIFSMFMSSPTFPDEMKVYYGDDNKKSASLLASMYLESRTVKLITKEKSHFFMPINRPQIDLPNILKIWDKIYDNYEVLATTFQYETNFRTLHEAHSDIVLYSTNIELISNDLGMKTSQKYAGPITHYGGDRLVAMLNIIFSKVNDDSLGVNISNLRNEIAHVGRPKKLMKKLSIGEYIEIGHLLRLVVVSHLFVQLGIGMDKIHKYQEKLIS